MDLKKVSIGIRTFLRDHQLFNTITAIRRTMPDAKMVLADCGEHTQEKYDLYSELSRHGHLCFTLPFDAGFGVMSNLLATAVTTPYLLIASDDFDFNPPEVRKGIERLTEVLDNNPEIDIASGRVNNKPYEFYLDDLGEEIRERPFPGCKDVDGWVYSVDLTVNYCLIRRQVFEGVPRDDVKPIRWDAEAKIGQGEHGAFFVDVKRQGYSVVLVPGVNINEQPNQNSERYREFRNRARSPERSCFKKRGIKKYVLGSGTVDYDEAINSR